MKKATQMVLDTLPVLEKYIEASEKNIEGLNQIESTFLKLVRFFEKPSENPVLLNELYANLSEDWIQLALNSVGVFFHHDTYLIQYPTHSFIDGSQFLNQKDFVEYLNENGENYSEAKMSVYIKRNRIPKPDLTISDTRYWMKPTCERYLKNLKEKAEGYHV